MNRCKKCIQPDTRPGIKFTAEGLCPACHYFTNVHPHVDWDQRLEELDMLLEDHDSHRDYDCVLGVSGGKDSHVLAMFLKERGIRPLLVCATYPSEQLTDVGRKNLDNLANIGFDLIQIRPNPVIWKKLMREGFLRYANWCKSTEMALYASSVTVAKNWGINLVFLGENPALTLGELSHGSINWDASRMQYSSTIASGIDDLKTDEMSDEDLSMYRYPELGDVQVAYLGYFIKTWNKQYNSELAIAYGLSKRENKPSESGAIFGDVEALDDNFVFVNQFLKYIKLGFGKVTDEVCEEIRFGRMSRTEGMSLQILYDGACHGKYIRPFCEFIGITIEQFALTVQEFRKHE